MGKKDVKGVLETLATIGYKKSRRQASFSFLDLQSSLLSRSQATKARQGTNPFNGEPMMFKAKPALAALC
jgi:hypothetical protein